MNTQFSVKPLTALSVAVALFLGLAGPTGVAGLGSSNFDTDDGNLRLDTDDVLDWANVAEDRQPDKTSGSGDDSFGQGSKEDTLTPSVVSGSIPPNKSDLKNFGVYLEKNGQRYLHLFWHRVQDPSGTTNMDFEFNQSSILSANGVTPVRTGGDVLILYDLSQGGTRPTLSVSRWLTSGSVADCEAANSLPCWGKRADLSGAGYASGSINTVAISASDADGLGAVSARTFGEASIDFSALVGAGECTSFGSAYLKSRSSDSFTASMKDFIAPKAVSVSNCGTLKVIKTDDATPAAVLAGAVFSLTGPVPGTDTKSCTTAADTGSCTFTSLLGGDYSLCETTAPAGHTLPDPACRSVTIAADAEVTVTFVDPRIPAEVTVLKKDDAGTLLNGATFTLYQDKAPTGSYGAEDSSTGKSCTTAGAGSCTIDDILPAGAYCLVETLTPAGYETAPAQCLSLALAQEVALTFVDPRKRGAILITKTRKHAADGAGSHPHAGVGFSITGGGLAAPVEVTTGSDGKACKDGLLLSSFVGNYSVTETVPTGYVADGALTKTVAVVNKGTCGSGNEAGVAFGNTPLTNITVSVDSQVVGGTKSTITCGLVSADTGAGGDGSLAINNLVPGTYSCTVVIDP